MKKIICLLIITLIPTIVFCEITRKITGKYSDGSPKEAVYYENNKEIAKENFKNEGDATLNGTVPDGGVKELNDAGNLIAEWNFKDGKREGGALSAYNDNEEQMFCKDIARNKLNATIKVFKEGFGQVRMVKEYGCKDGLLEGSSKSYKLENGLLDKEEVYKNGKTVQTREYFENGKVKAEINYKDGKFDGLSKVCFPDGRAKVMIYFKNGRRDGSCRTYNSEGKLLTDFNFKNGHQHGMQKSYDDLGKVLESVEYKDGKKDGIERKYYNDGRPKSAIGYKNGVLDGMSVTYDEETGKEAEKSFYKNGKKVEK